MEFESFLKKLSPKLEKGCIAESEMMKKSSRNTGKFQDLAHAFTRTHTRVCVHKDICIILCLYKYTHIYSNLQFFNI